MVKVRGPLFEGLVWRVATVLGPPPSARDTTCTAKYLGVVNKGMVRRWEQGSGKVELGNEQAWKCLGSSMER